MRGGTSQVARLYLSDINDVKQMRVFVNKYNLEIRIRLLAKVFFSIDFFNFMGNILYIFFAYIFYKRCEASWMNFRIEFPRVY